MGVMQVKGKRERGGERRKPERRPLENSAVIASSLSEKLIHRSAQAREDLRAVSFPFDEERD